MVFKSNDALREEMKLQTVSWMSLEDNVSIRVSTRVSIRVSISVSILVLTLRLSSDVSQTSTVMDDC